MDTDMTGILEASIERQNHLNEHPEVTAAHRCDGCGAAARYLMWKQGKALLALCGHHFRKSSDQLASTGWAILRKAAS